MRDSAGVAHGERQVVVAGVRARTYPAELLPECLRTVPGCARGVPHINDGSIWLAEVELTAGAAPTRHGRVGLREDNPGATPDGQVVATGKRLRESEVRAVGREPDEGVVFIRIHAAGGHRPVRRQHA